MPQQITKMESNDIILDIKNLKKYFSSNKGISRIIHGPKDVKAVNDISFQLKRGETYALVGESGCGKSTTGRTILRLLEATEGEVIYKGQNVFDLNSKELRGMRKDVQMIFQDPFSSLNPRNKIGSILEEPLKIHNIGTKKVRREMVQEIMEKVGLQPEHYYRLPHEFSGGQRQRIEIARSLILNPELIICDEPVSALDVAIQSQIINLMKQLQNEFNLTYLFISHDLSVVRHISDRIAVMYLGKIVEEGETEDLIDNPLHPYTQGLISAVPTTNVNQKKERILLEGEIPSPIDPPTGCVFHTRCPHVMDICKTEVPKTTEFEKERKVDCHLYN